MARPDLLSFRTRYGLHIIIAYVVAVTLAVTIGGVYALHQIGAQSTNTNAIVHQIKPLIQTVKKDQVSLQQAATNQVKLLTNLASISEELVRSHADTQKAIDGIESLLAFVATVQRSNAKRNPDVVKIENYLAALCKSVPGCVTRLGPSP